jgi:nitrogen-specific signal transduction histidine kinase/CheY-like chemotaxis protein
VEETREREKLQEHLRQTLKMEAIGTLAGGIAHDFNNMLAVIIGNAELALDETDATKPSRRNIEQIVKASKRASDLVKQILTFSRKTEAGKNPINLIPLIKETFKLLRGTLPSTIQMNVNIKTEKDTVMADPSQVQQVLMNLATNAAYAMRDKGGTLTIEMSDATVTDDALPDSEMQAGTYVRLSVRDTGTGIKTDVLHRIFEPFFTTKEEGQGTGMGLAVVYGIVKSHGGGITLETQQGKGSTFSVFLPYARSQTREKQDEQGDIPRGNERILLVDDEPEVVEMTALILRSLGYEVTGALSGSEAWNIFVKEPHGYDLVITDQTMPKITGIALAEKILAVRKEMPIIIFTGHSEAVSPEKAKTAGISEFLMKPVMKSRLAETVRRVLNSRDGGSDR